MDHQSRCGWPQSELDRHAFADFDPARVARFTPAREAKLLLDPAIVRHRQRIASAVTKARAFLTVQKEFGSFAAYIWGFVEGRTLLNSWSAPGQLPARTPESDAMSRDLERRGFKFVGSTICYAFMQATGLVNDHVVSCFRRVELPGGRAPGAGPRPRR